MISISHYSLLFFNQVDHLITQNIRSSVHKNVHSCDLVDVSNSEFIDLFKAVEIDEARYTAPSYDWKASKELNKELIEISCINESFFIFKYTDSYQAPETSKAVDLRGL